MADTHVTLTGNLTDDPDPRYTPNGTAVANFRVAVTARAKDGDSARWSRSRPTKWLPACGGPLPSPARANGSKGEGGGEFNEDAPF